MDAVTSSSQAKKILKTQLSYITIQIEERYFEGSGLALSGILFCDFNICCYKQKKGGHYVKLPFSYKGIINVQCEDNRCVSVEFTGGFIQSQQITNVMRVLTGFMKSISKSTAITQSVFRRCSQN